MAQAVLSSCGFPVVYRDTDSCYVKIRVLSGYSPEGALTGMRRICALAPFSMSMKVDGRFLKISLLEKETDFGSQSQNQWSSKVCGNRETTG